MALPFFYGLVAWPGAIAVALRLVRSRIVPPPRDYDAGPTPADDHPDRPFAKQ
jgi:hypothetical protein